MKTNRNLPSGRDVTLSLFFIELSTNFLTTSGVTQSDSLGDPNLIKTKIIEEIKPQFYIVRIQHAFTLQLTL